MKFCYCDPPYIGWAHKYPEKQEVDHKELVERLCREFPDGWALSLSSPSLQEILSYCPRDVRILAWTKTWTSWHLTSNPVYAWEPVILHGGRPYDRGKVWQVRDWVATSCRVGKRVTGVFGSKPLEFCQWILDCLGYQDGDEIVDLFPGSGIMQYAASQGRLQLYTEREPSLSGVSGVKAAEEPILEIEEC